MVRAVQGEAALLAHPGPVGSVMGVYLRLGERDEAGRYVYEKVRG